MFVNVNIKKYENGNNIKLVVYLEATAGISSQNLPIIIICSILISHRFAKLSDLL